VTLVLLVATSPLFPEFLISRLILQFIMFFMVKKFPRIAERPKAEF
jgi:hypothetical protein